MKISPSLFFVTTCIDSKSLSSVTFLSWDFETPKALFFSMISAYCLRVIFWQKYHQETMFMLVLKMNCFQNSEKSETITTFASSSLCHLRSSYSSFSSFRSSSLRFRCWFSSSETLVVAEPFLCQK